MRAGAALRTATAVALAGLGLLAQSAAASAVPLSPVNVSAAGQNAGQPQVAFNAAGDAALVWVRSNGSNTIVQSAGRTAGGSWSAPADLSLAGRSATEPQVALDGAGNSVAVWTRSNGSRTVIQGATRAAGGTWSAPVDLSDAEWNAEGPQVAIGPAGEAVAVWSRYNGTNYIVQSASRPAGGQWAPATDLSLAGRTAIEPQVALDGAGNAVAVWSRYDGSDYIVQAAIRPPGGGWEPALDLSATGESAEEPELALAPSGEAVAVWSRAEGPDLIVQGAARPPAGSWSPAADLSAAGKDAEGPQVAIGPAGEAVAVWVRGDLGLNSTTQAATRPPGGAWAPALDLSGAGMIAEDPHVAVDRAGEAVAVWTSSDASPSVILRATRPAGGGWSAPAGLSEVGWNAEEAQIALAGDDGAAVWVRENGANKIVQASGLDGGAPQLRNVSIPAAATMGQAASFSVSPFDIWSPISSTRWSFGAEGEVAASTATHVFASPGAYEVAVTATDGLGRSTTARGTVTVYPKARASRGLKVRGRLALLKVQCPSPAGCEGVAKLIAPVKVKRGGKLVRRRTLIGKSRFAVAGSTTATVPIRLTRPAVAAVRGAGRNGLKAQLTGPGIKHRVVALRGAG